MKLQDFITETLVQINDGIKNAKHKIEANQLQINPYITEKLSGIDANSDLIGFSEGKRMVQMVNFDISVTVENEKEQSGSIKVASSFIEAGVFGKKRNIEQNLSKIKFSIPISFPNSHEK